MSIAECLPQIFVNDVPVQYLEIPTITESLGQASELVWQELNQPLRPFFGETRFVTFEGEQLFIGNLSNGISVSYQPEGRLISYRAVDFSRHLHRVSLEIEFKRLGLKNCIETLLPLAGAEEFVTPLVFHTGTYMDTDSTSPTVGEELLIVNKPISILINDLFLNEALDQILLQANCRYRIDVPTGNLVIYQPGLELAGDRAPFYIELPLSPCFKPLDEAPENITLNWKAPEVSQESIIGHRGVITDTGKPADLKIIKDDIPANSVQRYFSILPDADRVRQVTITTIVCIISRFAGDGTADYTGDDGDPLLAAINEPLKLAIDTQGNVFCAMEISVGLAPPNHAIRKINVVTNKISSIIGNGLAPTGKPTFGIAAAGQRVGRPRAVATDDNDNFYYYDFDYAYIGKIDMSGVVTELINLLTFYASIGYTGGFSIAGIKSSGDKLYLVDVNANCVLRHNLTTHVTDVFAGQPGLPGHTGNGGLATACKFNEPVALAIDLVGNVYVNDYDGFTVRKIDVSAIPPTIDVFAGNGDGSTDIFEGTLLEVDTADGGMDFDSLGNLYMYDAALGSEEDKAYIRKFDTDGNVTIVAGTGTPGNSGDDGDPLAAEIGQRFIDIAINRSNNYKYITGENTIRVIKCAN